jgi:hypothetical protein
MQLSSAQPPHVGDPEHVALAIATADLDVFADSNARRDVHEAVGFSVALQRKAIVLTREATDFIWFRCPEPTNRSSVRLTSESLSIDVPGFVEGQAYQKSAAN